MQSIKSMLQGQLKVTHLSASNAVVIINFVAFHLQHISGDVLLWLQLHGILFSYVVIPLVGTSCLPLQFSQARETLDGALQGMYENVGASCPLYSCQPSLNQLDDFAP